MDAAARMAIAGRRGRPRPNTTAAQNPARPSARRIGLPVTPLVRDLASWSWRLLLIAGVLVALLWLAQRLSLVSIPMAISLLLTALLSPVVAALCRLRLPRTAATLITVVAGCGVLLGVLTWAVRTAVDSWGALVGAVRTTVASLPVSGGTLLRLRNDASGWLQTHRGELAQGALSGAASTAEVVASAVLTVVLTGILLQDGQNMGQWLLRHLPAEGRVPVRDAAMAAWQRLAGWIQGAFVVAIVHSSVVGTTLVVLGVPLVIPLVVLVFFGSFVPLFGALLAGGVALMVTLATKGVTSALLLLVVLLLDNQLESHVLQPFLVGRYVRLHPYVVAVVITAGGLLWGVTGALLAVPTTAAVTAAVASLHGTSTQDDRPGRRGEGGASARVEP